MQRQNFHFAAALLLYNLHRRPQNKVMDAYSSPHLSHAMDLGDALYIKNVKHDNFIAKKLCCIA